MATLNHIDRYVAVMSIVDAATRARMFGRADGAEDYLRAIMADGRSDVVDSLLRADVLAYLPEDLLVKMDRASMANSLEARAPLLDHRLMEFVASLPSHRKVTMRRTKVLLREIATELLTRELVERPKMGFGVPVGDWFMGALGTMFQETVLAPDARSRDYYDVTVAEELFNELRSGGMHHSHRLWLFLMFELWARRWLGEQAQAA